MANAAALHFALSTPNFLIQEDMLTDVPWRWDVVQSSLQTKDGYWLICDTPGLGIEVDEEAAKQHPFQQEVMHSTTVHSAGARRGHSRLVGNLRQAVSMQRAIT